MLYVVHVWKYLCSSAETGTVMRPSVLRMYAQQAGFRDVEILEAEHDWFRFYKLVG